MARNHTLRFMENNFAIRSSSYYTKSSEVTAYPFTNSQSDVRAKYWKPQGYFLIDATNEIIHINDGSDKQASVAQTAYTSPAALATAMQTALNAVSSGFTVTYSTTTYKFTIARSSSFTLKLSNSTSAIWSVIGFTTTSDIVVATSQTADQQRNHTEEFVTWDLVAQRPVTFFACIGPAGENFSISSGATLKLQANNINDFTSPALDLTLTRTDDGIFKFLDDQSDYTYRYWKFSIIDKQNTDGPEGIKISHIYLGDHTTFDDGRCVSHGYEKSLVDPSVQSEAESGTLYFDERVKFSLFQGLGLELLTRDGKDDLEAIYKVKGKTKPFYISVDPTLLYTDSLNELTKFVYFAEEPRFRHVMKDLFSTAVSFREVI